MDSAEQSPRPPFIPTADANGGRHQCLPTCGREYVLYYILYTCTTNADILQFTVAFVQLAQSTTSMITEFDRREATAWLRE